VRRLHPEALKTKEETMNSMMLDLIWTTAASASLAVLLIAGIAVLHRG